MVHQWRPDGPIPAEVSDAAVSAYGVLARKS